MEDVSLSNFSIISLACVTLMKTHNLTAVTQEEYAQSHNLSGRKGPRVVLVQLHAQRLMVNDEFRLPRALSHWVLTNLQGQSHSLSEQLVAVPNYLHSNVWGFVLLVH